MPDIIITYDSIYLFTKNILHKRKPSDCRLAELTEQRNIKLVFQ